MNDFPNLPKSWQVKTLGEIAHTTSGGTPSRKNLDYWNGNIKWLKSGELNDDYINEVEESITQIGLDKSSAKIFSKGTLLIALYGATIGKLGILNIEMATNQAICAITPNKDFEVKYLFHFLFSIRDKMIQDAFGGAQSNISQTYLKQLKIPIPPLEIQKRIVKRLDEAFSRIENGTKHLKSAKDNLTKYKQSLLKSAFNGTLTNDLLNGESTNLPQGWTIKTLGEIAKIKGGKRLPKDTKYAETITPYPYVRVTDFENMSVNTTNLKYLTKETQQKIKNYTISKNDVYISIAGSIGKVGTIPDELDNANLTENAAKIVHSMDKKYLAFYLNSAEVQSQIVFSTKATTQPKLALYRIENLKVKIPPLEIQKQIVAILEKHFTSADKVSAYIDSCLSKAKQLKSSLLKSAFAGKLV